MDVSKILAIITAATDIVTHVGDLIEEAKDVLSQEDAAQVKAAADKLRATNAQLEQQVLAKLG